MVDLVAAAIDLDRTFHPLTRRGRPFDQFCLVTVGPRSHVVGGVHRLVRGRSYLIDDQPLAATRSDVEQQVGKAQIGEERPFGGQSMQVIDVVAVERRVLAGQFGERGHHP